MSKLTFFVFLFLTVSLSCLEKTFSQNQSLPSTKMCQAFKNMGQDSFVLKSTINRSDTIDILNYSIHLDITDISNQFINGFCEIKFMLKESTQSIRLDLLGLEIDSILLEGSSLGFNYNDTLISIDFPNIIQPTDTSIITVYYKGNPKQDNSGWGGFYFQNGYAFNLGVGFDANPHNYGRIWFPCIDNFTERSTYDFHIITSDGKKAICNGLLTNETIISGDTIQRDWEITDEIPTYLACVAVANYQTVHQSYNGALGVVPIELYGTANDTANLKASFANLNTALECFEASYGPYVWSKVGYSLVPFNSGAMEHATNIAFPRSAANGTLTYEDLMAHELAHHWWGNLATCETAGDMWLNEGMASYSEFLFKEYLYNRETYNSLVHDNHEYVMHMAHIAEDGYRALYDIPHEYTYGNHVYLKGADIAHTLRGYLGDSLFFYGLTTFISNKKFKSMNSYEFRDHLSNITGIDLSDFFDKWVFNGGFPHFSIDSTQTVQNGPNFDISVFVKQKLTGTPFYFSNIPLEITYMGSSWQKSIHSFIADGSSSSAVHTVPFEPVYIAINMDGKISDAISSEYRTITSTGTYNFINNQNSHLTIEVHEVVDSALIRVEHNWASPDPFLGPSIYKLCPNRYWKVDGIKPSGLKLGGKVFYDGRQSGSYYYDHGLFNNVNSHEDSLALLYRRNAGDVWSEHPYYNVNPIVANDEWGMVTIDSLYLGEYVFALKGDPFSSSTLVSHINNITCKGLCNGEVSVTSQGGTPPYSFVWDDPNIQTTSIATGLCEGSYTVTVTDGAGKEAIIVATISSPDSLISTIHVQLESCVGCSDGSITASPIGGSTPYTYLWNDLLGTTSNTLSGIGNSETYSLTLLDANGCFKTYPELSLKIDFKKTLFEPKVYPNPNNNILYIDNDVPFKEPLLLKVCDTKGKAICQKQIKPNESSLQIITRNWQQGLYILTLSSQRGVCYKKSIVINR